MSTEIETFEGEIIDGTISATEKVDRLKSPDTIVYSTISDATFEGRLATVSALMNTVPLSDHLGEVINLANVVTQVVEINAKDENGKTRKVETVRIILVDDEGNAYHSVSDGVLSSVQTLFGGLGMPDTWPGGFVKVSPIEVKTRSGFRTMILTPVMN